ncbi:MAG TPA: O-antigen translocase [Chitinophagaceae bacterium]|nr:O-antigen translocase [Chitinophagaceae bacterium]
MKNLVRTVIRASKTEFVKVSAWSAVATFFKMISSFISIKVVSNIIGPAGIALVGQFMNSITMISTLGTGGIGQGVTKYIAEYYDKPDQQRLVIRNAASISFLCTILVSLLVIVFAHPLGNYIFKTNNYNSIIVLFGISTGLYSLNTLIINIVNGYKAFLKYVIINIATSLAGLTISVILVIYLGLYGALLNCVISQSVILLVTISFVFREPWFKEIFKRIRIDKKIVNNLGGFTLMVLTSSLLAPYSQITVRKYITEHLSLNQAGLWEAMNRISNMYLMVITTSISTFYLPRLSEIKSTVLLKNEILKTAKIVLPILAFTCLGIFLFRDLIIRVLFSKDFYGMRNLFAAQMVGDFFKISSWLIAYLFWAKALVKQFLITEILFNLLFIFFASSGVRYFGLEGSAYGYALNYIIYFAVMVLIFARLMKKN